MTIKPRIKGEAKAQGVGFASIVSELQITNLRTVMETEYLVSLSFIIKIKSGPQNRKRSFIKVAQATLEFQGLSADTVHIIVEM